MKVQDIMTSDAKTCGLDTNLAAAAMIMWDSDCGTVPVVDSEGKVLGMITDRDICMAAATKHRDAALISVGEVISGKVFACDPEDDIKAALKIMQNEKVRRLPVVDSDGALRGILSVNDIVLHAGKTEDKKTPEITYEDAVITLRAIGETQTPRLSETQQQAQAAGA